jgi:Matrixin
LITREFYPPFVTAKNNWDATKSKVEFAMNTTSPQLIVVDYKSPDGFDAKTAVDNTKPEYIWLNYTYLFGNTDTQLRSTTGHEIGHALGLDHPPKTTSQILMYTLQYRDRNVLYTPQTDDVNGVNSIYGYP